MYATDENGNMYIAMPQFGPPPSQKARNLQAQTDDVRYDPDMIKQQLHIEMQQQMVRTLQMDAQRRMMEGQLLLNGMQEIRTALERYSIAEDDSGGMSDSRPPLKQLFDEINSGMLQQDYLALCKQYVSFAKTLEQERIAKENPDTKVPGPEKI